jgi:hypothetical protein
MKVFCDFIFLDTDERRRFAQVSHEYLIEQIQYSNEYSVTGGNGNQVELNFNHPVKELIFSLKRSVQTGIETVIHPFDFWGINPPYNYEIDLLENLVLQLNGQDRFKVRDGTYFRCVQPFQHHTGCNRQVGFRSPVPLPLYDYLLEPFGGFYVYSFALEPEKHQPSGTCNFSRVDNVILQFNTQTQATSLKVWAINYNILRIMSGMGGLAYSN